MKPISRKKCLDDRITYGAQIVLRNLIKDTGGDPVNDLIVVPPDGVQSSVFEGRFKRRKSYAGNGPLPPIGKSSANEDTVACGMTENDMYNRLLYAVLFPVKSNVQGSGGKSAQEDYLYVIGKDGELKAIPIVDDDGPSPVATAKKQRPLDLVRT